MKKNEKRRITLYVWDSPSSVTNDERIVFDSNSININNNNNNNNNTTCDAMRERDGYHCDVAYTVVGVQRLRLEGRFGKV